MTVALSSCGMSKNTAGTDNGQIKLKIAAIYSAGSLSDDILKFKKDNPGIDIEVKTYESYAEPERSFIMDLTSGDLPDVIVAPRNILFKLVKRGLIEDIYPYIDSDKELSREDFLPSVLNAYEIDGKLYQTVSLVNLHSWATEKNEYTITGRWNLESFKNYIEGNKEKKVLVSYSMDGISKAILTGVL
ncbi:MAG: extracellular solute-binding protein, partial [Lachnospiraceae bacterium]|nr:extracellular solute-binding protein [Lachnospiraceae bacterium]